MIAGTASIFHQGLEYTAVESVMRMRGIDDQSRCLDQVQHIEGGALDILNESS